MEDQVLSKAFLFSSISVRQLLAANAEAVAYHKLIRFGCDFALLEQFSTQQLIGIFTIISFEVYELLREMPFVFPHFITAAIPYVKWDVGSERENENDNDSDGPADSVGSVLLFDADSSTTFFSFAVLFLSLAVLFFSSDFSSLQCYIFSCKFLYHFPWFF